MPYLTPFAPVCQTRHELDQSQNRGICHAEDKGWEVYEGLLSSRTGHSYLAEDERVASFDSSVARALNIRKGKATVYFEVDQISMCEAKL